MQVTDTLFMTQLFSNSVPIESESSKKGYYKVQQGQDFCYYRLQFDMINADNFSPEMIEPQLNQVSELIMKMYYMGEQNNSDRIIKYDSVVISYPFACFFHQPIECTLLGYMNNNKELGYRKRLKIMKELALAVKEIHDKKICHRKLNPFNVLVRKMPENRLVLMLGDFSQAVKEVQENKKIPTKLEDLSFFSAPEVRSGGAHGLSCDIWSLGAIFNFILFGSLEQIQVKSAAVNYNFPLKHSFWIKDFLEKLLCFEPAGRYKINDVITVIKSAEICQQVTQKMFQGQ